MWTTGVAFGQRVAVLDPRGPDFTVPLRLLSPGDGADLRRRAASARNSSDHIRDLRHREVIQPGRPSWQERVRQECLGGDPAQVDEPARFRLFPTDRADVRRYEVLGRWGAWRQRIGDLLDGISDTTVGTEPGAASASSRMGAAPLPMAEFAAALAQRPDLSDAPSGGGIGHGLDSWRAQALLDSLAARAVLIAALQGEQYADAAEFAEAYPANQEFLTAEVSIALQVPESEAAALVCTGTHLAARLPATLAACRTGRITAESAQVILGATTVVDDLQVLAAVEAAVLPHTRWKTRESLRRRVVREVIRRDPDGADRRHTAAKGKRCVSKWSDVDGMGWLKLHAAAQDIAAVWEAVTGLAQAAKTPGCTTTLDQRRADAMCDVFSTVLDRGGFDGTVLPTQHGRRPHIEVLIPADLLAPTGDRTAESPGEGCTAGEPIADRDPTVGGPDTAGSGRRRTSRAADPPGPAAGGVCDLTGYGPIAPSQALQLAAEGLWRRLVCDPLSGRLLDYGRTRYEPPDALKQFVVTRDRRCQHPGCALPAWRAQIDHVHPYSQGGLTDEANLVALCFHHHRAKDGGGFTLRVNPDRTRTWTTPLGRTVTVAPDPLLEPTPPPLPAAAPNPAPAAPNQAEPEPPF